MSIEQRDIRYFYEEDRPAAQLLRKQIQEFLELKAPGAADIDMDIKGFVGQYPGVRKGQLEVWFYL